MNLNNNKLHLMESEKLIQSLINDILNNKKIIFLIGSGMSLKSDPHLKDGIGDSRFFTEKFKGLLRDGYNTTRKVEYEKLIKEAEKSANEYSFLAKKIIESKPTKQGIRDISKLFKTEILPILNLKNIDISNNNNISYAIKNPETCKNIRLNPGFEAFGKLGKYFQKSTRIITANFDPFIEVALRKNDIDIYQFSYSYNLEHRNVFSPTKNEIVVEHYHGYFLSETAHNDLGENYNNKDQFKEIIKESDCIYVFGFGGWKDAFTQAISESIDNTSNQCVFHWAFHSGKKEVERKVAKLENEQFALLQQIIQKETCQSYFNINTNRFFPQLLTKFREKIFENALENYVKEKRKELKIKNRKQVFERTPFKVGKLNERYSIETTENITRYIYNKLINNNSIVVCSKFGMGKTTILENAFLDYTKDHFNYSLIINLAYHELSHLLDESHSFCHTILNELDFKNQDIEKEAFLDIIDKYLHDNDRKLLLILDAIDESVFKDEELNQFREKLKNLDYSILTSIRLEFHDFIDNAIELIKWNYEAVELVEWTEGIVNEYLISINIEDVKSNKIKEFTNLNNRPLFIDMIVKLNNDSLKNISDNIASLYYHTIIAAIDNEIRNAFTNEIENRYFYLSIKREYFDFLNSIAIAIYMEFQHYKYETNYFSKPRVIFTDENIRLLVSKNKFLDYDRIKKIFEQTVSNGIKLIKVIEKKQSKFYTFFHRSFFEYLVANGAAVKILRDKRCSEAWDVYQTDEVSEYFVQEIKREKVQKSREKKDSFFVAFDIEFIGMRNELDKLKLNRSEDELQEYIKNIESGEKDNAIKEYYSFRRNINERTVVFKNQLIEYSERLEEAIYYIGKFQDFWTEEQKSTFSHYCMIMFFNSRVTYKDEIINEFIPIIDPVYYRTSSITLSRLINNSYIFDYISYLFLDYLTTDKKYFFTQIRKDTRYYGKEQLEEKCILAFNEILEIKNEVDLKPLQILKVFSLFISLWYDSSDKTKQPSASLNIDKFNEVKYRFENLKEHCEKWSFTNTLDILEGIEYILRDISFEVRIQNVNVELLLKEAIEKRNHVEREMFRIVNSCGDGLDYFDVDYYAGHVIIDAKKKYYYENRKQIIEILTSNLKQPIISISYNNNNYDVDLRLKGKEFETLYGQNDFNSRIDCNEIIDIIVKPINFPKTGFFIDNRNIRTFLSKNSEGKKVLNLCSYTCTLGAIARTNGATSVINVDKNGGFLELGKDIYRKQKPKIVFEDSEFINKDVNEYLDSIPKNDEFDIIILDLPEISPIPCNFINTENTYRSINKKCLKRLSQNGILITSCCSHGFRRERYQRVISNVIAGTDFYIDKECVFDKLEDHPIKVGDSNSDYLKIYVLKRKI